MCEKTITGVDVQGQPELRGASFEMQQESSTDERGWKPAYKRAGFQNILSRGGNSFLCEICQVTLLNHVSVVQHVAGKKHAKKLATGALHFESLWKMIRKFEGGKTDNIYMTFHNKFRCRLCCKNLDVSDVVSHVGGSTHQQKLEELKETKNKGKDAHVSEKCMSYDVHNIWNEIYKAENGKWSNICYISGQTYRCEPCNIILSIDKVLAHVMDASHQEAIREPKNVRTNETLMQIAADIWQKIHAADRTHEVCFKIDTCTVIYCTSCCVKVPASIDNVVDHIRGKNHMATVTKTLISSQHSCVMKQGNCSDEGKSPSPKPTKNQTLTGRRLSESAPSKDLLNSKSSQPQICKTTYDVQEALVNALMPNPKGISCQSTSMLKEKSVSFICVICDSKFESEELWCQHTCSRGHRIPAGKLLTEGKNLVSRKCFGCGAMVYCIQSDFAKHNCSKVENFVPSNNILGEIAGNDQQINESNATVSFHKGNVKWKEQDEITDNVPRIIVHGYPKHFGLERLFNFFKDFGSVSFIVVTDGSAIIEFTENASVERALARPLFIGEAALTVKSLTNFVHQVPEPTVSVHESLVSTFTSPQRVEERLNALCTASSSLSDPEKHEQVCLFLEESCTEIFPGCKAIPFGSRVSGLALHDSDLDVFLDTGDMYGGKQNQESAIQELIVSSTGNRLINRPECCNVQEIRNARTPIVKFFYKPIETQCDVAFSHGLGCENTMLIKFYLSLDPRVRPVIIFLKHWAHIHQLIGQSKITNYALAWLVIFYLQKVSGFGLPTVQVLHKLHKGPEKLIAGWECSFNVNKLKIPRINNSQRILQLLHGFFMYYYKFDFSKNVVCPLIGLPVRRKLFAFNPKDLPDAMDAYVCRVVNNKHAERFFTKCCMCVQDPFDQSHNLTKGTTAVTLQKFKILCKLTGDLCADIIN